MRGLGKRSSMDKSRRRTLLSWVFVSAMFVLCGVLGVLQYRWIDEVSVAAHERLRGSLQASLRRLSHDFNSEITAACRALLPTAPLTDNHSAETEIATRYEVWRKTSGHARLFRRVGLAVSRDHAIVFEALDPEKAIFTPAEWPAEWKAVKERLEFRLSPEPWKNRTPPGAPPDDDGVTLELPLFGNRPPAPPPAQFGPRETEWLIVEVNLPYVREVMLPELLQHHLGAGGTPDYQAEVLTNGNPPALIYQSDPDRKKQIGITADASVSLFELQYDQLFRPWRPPGMRERRPGLRRPGPGGPDRDAGRWQLLVRHRAGSLETVVAQARLRNLAVNAVVLLLLVASLAALIRYTRRAQRLAELQMDFVAGISHELRTPLAVIQTAAYNLRGKLANNPNQVEKYGELIQQESGRLKELVEQVLRFAGAKAGRAIREPEPLSMEDLIEETVKSSRPAIEEARCVVEKNIEPGLPLILGDSTALKHALENLLGNAVKYATADSKWIGISASRTADRERWAVEIRVADRGPGIPVEEQGHIFDPFFRGKRALQDQIHGTGLGLSLVREIVEAHGGKIAVHSGPTKGTEFVIHIPAAPQEYQDELANSVSRG
jgi:signal transduction histidine kinase